MSGVKATLGTALLLLSITTSYAAIKAYVEPAEDRNYSRMSEAYSIKAAFSGDYNFKNLHELAMQQGSMQ